MWASSWGFEQGRHYVILHILICLVHLYACPFHRRALPQTLGKKNTNTHTAPIIVASISLEKCEKPRLLLYKEGLNNLCAGRWKLSNATTVKQQLQKSVLEAISDPRAGVEYSGIMAYWGSQTDRVALSR